MERIPQSSKSGSGEQLIMPNYHMIIYYPQPTHKHQTPSQLHSKTHVDIVPSALPFQSLPLTILGKSSFTVPHFPLIPAPTSFSKLNDPRGVRARMYSVFHKLQDTRCSQEHNVGTYSTQVSTP